MLGAPTPGATGPGCEGPEAAGLDEVRPFVAWLTASAAGVTGVDEPAP